MLRKLLLFILVFSCLKGKGNDHIIQLDEGSLNSSVSNKAFFLEDKEKKLTIENILNDSTLEFRTGKNKVEKLDFTASSFWVKFRVQNLLRKEIYFILETARPITNHVDLYQVQGNRVVRKYLSGDNIPYSERAFPHRKCLFKISLNDNNPRDFILRLDSDGEVLSVPLIFWQQDEFMKQDYQTNLLYGIFYGILIFVTVIYFFFFFALREPSFIYYVAYVISMILLQASLDGYAYQFVLSSSPYLSDHFVLIAAGAAVFFVLLFGNDFLKLKIHAPGFHKVYKYMIPIIAGIVLLSLLPGPQYKIMYPLINVATMISLVLTLTTISYMKVKGKPVDGFFFTAFTLLIISAIIFVLGQFNVIENIVFTESILKAGSCLEVIFLSLSLANKYREIQEAKELAQKELLIQLEEKGKFQAEINIRLEQQVKERTREIEHQKEELKEKNKEILDSINYAKRIQYAILPPEELIKKTIPDGFIFYRPKDIVSGDFYFVYPVTTSEDPPREFSLFAAVDCTGHGVPGAFMSILGNNILKATLSEKDVNSPAEALDYLNRNIISTLSQSNQDVALRDGMDIALCAIDRTSSKLHYSGANNPAWIISTRSGPPELIELTPDKQPIGNYGNNSPFTNHTIDLFPGDMIYVFTDGFADQFGGPKGKKFKYSQLKELFLKIWEMPSEEQRTILEETFLNWKGKLDQIDDVLLIGVRY